MDQYSLSKWIANLSPAKRALLELRLKGIALDTLAGRTIPRRQTREIAPLSFAQERLWFLNQLEPESPAYNEPRALRLTGLLNLEALECSLNAIIQRHETLRTTFVMVDGVPMQRIAERRDIEVPLIDLQTINENERDAQARRLIDETICRPFDLSKDCVLRTLLLRLSEQEHIFVLVKHHIASDGWSSGIFWQEFQSIYTAFTSGSSAELPELPIQYADFALWQRDWLQGETLENQLSYWRKQLNDLTALQLPTDRPRPELLNPRGATKSFLINNKISAALKTLSRESGVTLFMTLLAAFQTLLCRYTNQEDISVGSPIAGRNRIELEGLIGFFVNTLVLRADLTNNPSFRALLERVRKACLEAYSHQELPFEKLVEELQPERRLSQNPLFQVSFQLNSSSRKSMALPGLGVEAIELSDGMSKFDLSLSMVDSDSTISGRLLYNTDLFDVSTIERMLSHLQTLLEGIVANPDQRIGELPLLTEAEKRQLLVAWNDTRRDYPKDKCIHELFEEQVERSPDSIAVVFEEQQLTYKELNRRANQLAHYLRKLGVRPETLVGICVERSIEMIVGLLGILKAGGAYVPLDPSYPKERLAFMLEDTQAAVLVTQSQFVSQLPKLTDDGQPTTANNDQHRSGVTGPRSRMVCLDADWEQVALEDGENQSSGTTAENLAYVIYTSGSTGKPKGVMIPHRAVVNHMLWMQEALPLSESDCVLQKTPFSFDASIWEFYAPLLAGASLVMAPPQAHQDSACLVKVLAEQQVTVLQLVPSMLRVLVEEEGLKSCQSLRRVFCGGEVLPFQLTERFSGRSKAELYNLYGPTEASIDVTCGICEHSDGQSVSIGRPIANMQVYILDSHLQPVPIGVTGELYIGGDGLARAYLNRPELTAEKFIPNPFSDEFNSRLYCTGDLARYRSDGSIEFLGRIDNQVKIRGYRIELGEIETVLSKHPVVRQSVVMVREDSPGERRLVAYVVSSPDQVCTASELRTFLKQKLPDYMVPSAIVLLDSLPLTPNGKLDREALPAPDQNRPELDETYAAPGTPVEELLTEIWSDLLKVDKVGIHGNFFDLGGHSLLAAQLVSRIRDAFRIELPLRTLFEGPTVAEIAKHVELARQETAGIRALPIVPEVIDAECPLSFAQERFWFLEQLEPNNLAYHVTYGFRLIGPLNSAALEKALSELVQRHETLRTTFSVKDGKPVQVISEQWLSPLKTIDLRQYPSADREAEVQGILESERRCVFDLSRDLLLQATLMLLGTDEHVLLLNSHHIAWDRWCIDILFREFAVLYRAYVAGKPSPLPDPTIQYRHYALWQRKVFDHAELQDHLTYWKERLRGVPQSLNLPTDHPRKPLGHRRGGRQSLILPKRLTADLQALSRRSGVTFFMVFLAAFQTLLHRITHQDDIVVGTPIAGRDRSETEGLIGLFLNSLALRTDVSGNPTFLELLMRVRDVALGAYDHQDLPFEKLVEELQPERDLTQTPIFQVFVNLYNFKEATFQLDRLRVERLKVREAAPQFDIEFSIREHDDSTHLVFTYDADRFDAPTITRMLSHFVTLLEGIVVNPDQRISELPLLTEPEKQQLLIERNDTKRAYPKDKCIHQLFEDQVKHTPDSMAVIFGDQQLTYRELNARANQLAHYLRKVGVQPETLIGISVKRSLEMVVGLLGILKAGGAYVPLDPDYPKERLAFMLEDTRAKVLLTQERLIEKLPDHNTQLVCLDRDWEEVSKESRENPRGNAAAENLAYVIYTSGSTGIPKGVEVRHRGVVRLLFGVDYVQLDTTRTFLHLAPISFDASTFEVWGALLHGGKCVLFPGKVPSAKEIGELLKTHQVTTLWLTAALFNTVINDEPQALSDVKQLLIGGEALSVSHVKKGIALLPNSEIVNGYGPTESTTFTCCYPIPRQLDDNLSSIPIGKPIGNTQVYILDSHLNPVPIGVPGELHIGGDGLARGYLNRRELTQEKFIPNPFSADPASRLYKTGDLARYLPDGNIEFLGRMDNQVKIRGYRIELGEIEAVLDQHPTVRDAVVLAREDSPGERRLVAYFVAAPGLAPSANELRSFLQQKLPDYMVPSAFMFFESLPLTPNGKVDRKALPAPDQSRPELGESYSGPRTPVEELLANIWAEVLKLDKVGIHDNFFHLGGHSLLATRVVSRVREAFQVELPLRTLFESPTVAGLAGQMEATHYKESNITPAPMVPVVRDKKLSLSFSQQRLWFLDQYEPNSSVYKMSSAHRLRGALDVAALEQSLGEIVRRHEALRTRFSVEGGEPVQVIAPAGNISLSVVDLSHFFESDREGEAQRLATAEARRPFDLSEGPLFRASVLRLSEEDHVLLCTMHHIVSDGWSMGVLNRELSVLYQAFTQDKPSPLPDLPIQYADYAVWQREWLKGEELERQLSYWKKQLEGAPGVLNLPTDRPRPALQSHRGARQSITLSKDLSEKLKAMSRKEGVTLYMTLLAAFQTLLYRYTGQEEIVVGSPIANRTRTEIEGLIGFFVNTLVLRSNFSNNPTFKALLARVRVTALGAYTHQDLPFEKLVEELHPERSLSHSPLFQVLFNMVDQENFKLDLPGLTTARLSFSEAESKFDLTLYVKEQNDVISFNLVYRVDLFSESWMTCFLQQYRYLLEQIVSDPEKPVRSYSLVTPESGVLLPDPSAVLAEPLQQLVTDAFLSWAKKTPAQTAISQGEHTWTYEQLGERADTIGRALKVSGLEPGAVVAVHGRRSLGLIAAMIGTLLSGGVLLLIDHHLPIQRKQLMLKEGRGRKILFIGDGNKDWVNADKPIDSLSIEARTGLIIDFDSSGDLKTTSLPEVSPHDPAYIFFTSGTTGIPKAVLGCHKGLSHFLKWQRETFAIEPNDRVAQLTNLSFDPVLRDIFLPLTSGATLCLPEQNDNPGSDGMIRWLEHERISVLHTVPSLAESWLASAARPFSLSDMRRVFFAGELLTDALVRQWQSSFQSAAEIINLYGPTETTLAKCFYRVPANMRSGIQPVGSPITGVQALVLAHDNQLCGVNEPGEIVLRTPFRSLGYLNAPEESQKRFVKNPFREDPGDLIYFTGDAGRYRPDGSLEILGRLDDQVKIRGVRVEPAEVTAILSQHPLVDSCIVVGKKNERGEMCLVAYVVASEQGQATSTQLRSYLLEQLPAAMVPSVFVFLDSLPLTPNGKVDRKALPEGEQRTESEESFVAPRTELEKIVAGVWAEVLKLERVGVHDNFFDAGGHSLLATQTLSRIRAALQVDLSVRALFEKPTVASLCEHIEATRWGRQNKSTELNGQL